MGDAKEHHCREQGDQTMAHSEHECACKSQRGGDAEKGIFVPARRSPYKY